MTTTQFAEPMNSPRDLPAYDNPPENTRVRALLCEDKQGQVQVIAPEGVLVDPDPICQTTARDLRSLPVAEDAPVCAIPGFYGLPSVVHDQLKRADVLALATETPDQYVRTTGAELHHMCSSHASFEAQFCEELLPTPIQRMDDEQDILAAVDAFTARRIEARLDETLHIPPLPEAARRIIALQQNPDFDLSELVQIIETDPSLSARIMGWANSALYASPTPAKTLSDAIMRVLGFDVVFNMALGMAIGATLKLPSSHVSGASPYWLTAVYTAATMEALAHQAKGQDRANPGTCYLVGLLANFGTLVVGHVFPPQFETICRLQEANPKIHHAHVDQHVLSLNREVIASTLLELWELPDEVTTAMRYQYVADYSGEHQTYVDLLRLSHTLSAQAEEGVSSLDECESLDEFDALNLDWDGVEEVMETIHDSKVELGDIASSF
ncbi:MAG: HDOD domain-containing protein [Pseudomonadales bacterium]|nr:HDOD domain-containing protein [Pseudomonadales bacterium]